MFCSRSFRKEKAFPTVLLQRLELAAWDVVVAHASAKSYTSAAQDAKEAGWSAAKAERTKRTRVRKDVPDQTCFLVCAVCILDVRVCGQGGRKVREPPSRHLS